MGEPTPDKNDEFDDSELSEEATEEDLASSEDKNDEFDDSELSEEPTQDSDDDELSEEPTEEDLAPSEEESEKLEEAESNQELPEASAVPGEEAKELDVLESPEQPKEELNVAIEHESAPADVVMKNKTEDSKVLKVVL